MALSFQETLKNPRNLQAEPVGYSFILTGGDGDMKDQTKRSRDGSISTAAINEKGDADQAMVAFLEEHFPELDPEHFLRWSRAALKVQWEAQRRVVN